MENLYKEVLQQTKEFNDFSMESLFKATENNKLMQKKKNMIAG